LGHEPVDQVAVADDQLAPVLGDRPGIGLEGGGGLGRPGGDPVLGQVVEELGLAWRQPVPLGGRRNALLQEVRREQRDTGQVLGDDRCGLDGPCPGAVVDGGERDPLELLPEKLGLLAADRGESPSSWLAAWAASDSP
jgi:hypothetical protein